LTIIVAYTQKGDFKVTKRKIPDVLSKEEQKKLLDVFNTRYISSHRNKVMIKLMLNSGLRLSELIHLSWKEVNLQTGRLKVVSGKGDKDRILWINESTLDTLREWRNRQNDKLGDIKLVFTTKSGKKIRPGDIRKMVYTYAKKAGIKDKQVSPHTFRHTFATDLLRETKVLRLVQKALGHSNISTTQIYTHIVDEELEKALREFKDDG